MARTVSSVILLPLVNFSVSQTAVTFQPAKNILSILQSVREIASQPVSFFVLLTTFTSSQSVLRGYKQSTRAFRKRKNGSELCSNPFREFTKPRRRCRGERRLKTEFIFYVQISRYSKVINLFITVKTMAELNPELSGNFEIKIQKISRGGSCSPDNAKFGLAEDSKEMYQELKRTCTAIVLLINFFCSLTFPFPLPSPSWFRKFTYNMSGLRPVN